MGKSSGANRVRGKRQKLKPEKERKVGGESSGGKRQKLKPEAERKVGGESSGGGSSWGKNKCVSPPPPAEKTSLPPRLGLKESRTYEEFIRNALARTRARRCNPYIGFEPFGGEKMADESTIERYLEQIEESDVSILSHSLSFLPFLPSPVVFNDITYCSFSFFNLSLSISIYTGGNYNCECVIDLMLHGFDIDVFAGGRETIYVPIRNFQNDTQLHQGRVELAIMALKVFNDKNKDTRDY